VAKADLALRLNPLSKRMVLERFVMDLTTEPKLEAPDCMQEQLPVRNAAVYYQLQAFFNLPASPPQPSE
jgi:hypothetical protein